MFHRHPPPRDDLIRRLESLRDAPFTYPFVGLTRETAPERPAGFFADRVQVSLGHGADAYARGAAALERWVPFDLPWIGLVQSSTALVPGTCLAVVARTFGLWSAHATRIVWVRDEPAEGERPRRFGFAYGTLPMHAERGEESFIVSMAPDGRVDFEIVAFSRPSRAWIWLGLPIALLFQNRFRRDAARRMREAVRS